MVEGALSPVQEDPFLNAGLKVMMGPIAPALALVGALQAAGVPTDPANSTGAYQASLARQNGGMGQPNDPLWTTEEMEASRNLTEPDADPLTMPGNIWTAGGVTPTQLPKPQIIEEPVSDEALAAQASQPTSLSSMATKVSPLGKTVKSALTKSPVSQVG